MLTLSLSWLAILLGAPCQASGPGTDSPLPQHVFYGHLTSDPGHSPATLDAATDTMALRIPELQTSVSEVEEEGFALDGPYDPFPSLSPFACKILPPPAAVFPPPFAPYPLRC